MSAITNNAVHSWSVQLDVDGVDGENYVFCLSKVLPCKSLDGVLHPPTDARGFNDTNYLRGSDTSPIEDSRDWRLPYGLQVGGNGWLVFEDGRLASEVVNEEQARNPITTTPSISEIRTAHSKEVNSRLDRDNYPYSQSSQLVGAVAQGSKQKAKVSLPHQIASLCQLPVVLSESVFEATRIFKLPKNNFQANKYYVVVPHKLKCGDVEYEAENTLSENMSSADSLCTIKYIEETGSYPIYLITQSVKIPHQLNGEADPLGEVSVNVDCLSDRSRVHRLSVLADNLNVGAVLDAVISAVRENKIDLTYEQVVNAMTIAFGIGNLRYESTPPRPTASVFDSVRSALQDQNMPLKNGKEFFEALGNAEEHVKGGEPVLKYLLSHMNLPEGKTITLGDNVDASLKLTLGQVWSSAEHWHSWYHDVAIELLSTSGNPGLQAWVEKYMNHVSKYEYSGSLRDFMERNPQDDRIRLGWMYRENDTRKELAKFVNSVALKDEVLNDIKSKLAALIFTKMVDGSLFTISNQPSETECIAQENIKNAITRAVCEQLDSANQAIHKESAPLTNERGIAIVLDDNGSDVDAKRIRGYVVALASAESADGKEKKKAEWLTRRHIKIKNLDTNKYQNLIIDGDADVVADLAWGAHKQYGEVKDSLPFSGKTFVTPVVPGDAQDEDLDVLDFDSSKFTLPSLAYGFFYHAFASRMLNSGWITNSACCFSNDTGLDRYRTCEADQLPWGEKRNWTQYLCRVAPTFELQFDAPFRSVHDIDDLSTLFFQADWEEQSRSSDNKLKVYFLAAQEVGAEHKRYLDNVKSNLNIKIKPSALDVTVWQRWIEADLLDSKNSGKSLNAHGGKIGPNEFNLEGAKKHLDSLAAKSNKNTSTVTAFHPALQRFGVEIVAYSIGKQKKSTKKFITGAIKIGFNAPNELRTDDISLTAKLSFKDEQSTIKIEGLKPIDREPFSGEWVDTQVLRIRVYPLIAGKYLDDETLRRMEKLQGWTPSHDFGKQYVCGPADEFWIEALPSGKLLDAVAETTSKLISAAKSKIFDDERQAVISIVGNEISAEALHIFGQMDMQMTAPAWSGYPAALSLMDSEGKPQLDLAERMLSTWGAKSVHEKLFFNKQAWTDKLLIAPTQDNAFSARSSTLNTGPAMGTMAIYGVCRVQPMLRYRSLMAPNTYRELINKIETAVAKEVRPFFLKARATADSDTVWQYPVHFDRLIPTFGWHKSDNKGEKLSNQGGGVMAIFAEPFYRLEPVQKGPGLAERIEISVCPTRLEKVMEIGPNPVFHAAPVAKGSNNSPVIVLPYSDPTKNSLCVNWGVRHTEFIALTVDKGLNAKILQSACVLYPIGNDTHAFEVMAKMHTRRSVDPAMVTGADLEKVKTSDVESYHLKVLHTSGDSYLGNFCISFNLEGHKNIELNIFAPNIPSWPDKPLPLSTKTEPLRKGKYRALVSWHKGIWLENSLEEVWAPQLIVERLEEINDTQSYQWTQCLVHSCFANAGSASIRSTELATVNEACIKIIGEGVTVLSACKWFVSEYSQPRWLQFPGSASRQKRFLSERWVGVFENENGIFLQRSSSNYVGGKWWATVETVEQDLIIYPLNDEEFAIPTEDMKTKIEKQRFDLLFVFESFDSMSIEGKFDKEQILHSIWYPTRTINDKGQLQKLVFKPMGIPTCTLDVEDKEYSAQLFGFLIEHTKPSVETTLKDRREKIFSALNNSSNPINALRDLLFPVNTNSENGLPRPYLQLRGPRSGMVLISDIELKFDQLDFDSDIKITLKPKDDNPGKDSIEFALHRDLMRWSLVACKGRNAKKIMIKLNNYLNGMSNGDLVMECESFNGTNSTTPLQEIYRLRLPGENWLLACMSGSTVAFADGVDISGIWEWNLSAN